METTIPFSGFYESIHNHAIESMHGVTDDDYYMAERETEKNTPKEQREYPTYEELEAKMDAIDWKKEMKEYAEEYANEFCRLAGIKEYTFKALESPREYNFTTDRIFIDIPETEVLRMYNAVDHEKLAKRVTDSFTSRSGFSSHYPNDVLEWENVLTWDHNQLGTLVEEYASAMLDEEYELDIMETISY